MIASLTTSLVSRGFPVGTGGKEPTANARDLRDWGSVPGSGRPPGGGHGNRLQCSYLEDLKDRGAGWAMVHQVAKRRSRLKQLSMHAWVSRVAPVPDLESAIYQRKPDFLCWAIDSLDYSVDVRGLYFMTIMWLLTVIENIGCVLASQVMLVVKNPPANAGDIRDLGVIPGSGSSPGGGHSSPLQCSCLDNLMDRSPVGYSPWSQSRT